MAVQIACFAQKFIAHYIEEEKHHFIQLLNKSLPSHIILPAPEVDFSPKEIDHALTNQFIPVSPGETRLRAETPGVIAAALMR